MREKLISNLFFRVSNPLPAWSLGFYRIVFGILLFILAFRYFSNGWISKYFLDPSFHFKFYGLSWIAVFPAWILYSLFVSLLFLAVFISLGIFYRISVLCFFLIFSYINLLEVAVYLNHYYLVCLLLFLLIWVPADRALNIFHIFRIFKNKSILETDPVPAWNLYILRFQIGVVYFLVELVNWFQTGFLTRSRFESGFFVIRIFLFLVRYFPCQLLGIFSVMRV